jgi:uncharacterized protein with FMN-binding domain
MRLVKFFSLFVGLFLLLFVVGCISNPTEQKETKQKEENNFEKEEKNNFEKEENNFAENNNSSLLKNITMTDNKTNYEKINQTIQTTIQDGLYTKNVSYFYHSGKVDMNIQIEVKDDYLVSVSLSPINADPVSENFIKKVNSSLQQLAVGKKITDLSLPKQISGSSLTTAAFKKYVEELIQK